MIGPNVRPTDPETSHIAAAKERDTDREMVLRVHYRYSLGLTDFELADIVDRQQTSAGKRRGELRDNGYIEETEFRRNAPSGSPAIVWRITKLGKTAVEENRIMINLNHGSGSITGEQTVDYTVSEQINQHVTAALFARRQQALAETPRDYIGMSELGERCLRHLYLKHMGVPEDEPLTGERLRAFEMGHFFEEMVYQWMNAAGFKILRRDKNTGKPFEFTTANGFIKGHIDGALVSGPPIPNFVYPGIWENKALKAKYWNAIVKHGLQKANPEYWIQTQQYMGYSQLINALFTTINKDTAEIYHCVIPYQASAVQKAMDKGASLIKALQMQLIPARIAANSDFYICKQCDRRNACWSTAT